jgi:hypothetical protein
VQSYGLGDRNAEAPSIGFAAKKQKSVCFYMDLAQKLKEKSEEIGELIYGGDLVL